MFKQIFYPGLLAGVIAGLFLFSAQQIKLLPLILEAEKFENAAPASGGDRQPSAPQTTVQGAAPASPSGTVHLHEDGQRHLHSDGDEWAPDDGFQRIAFSLLSNVITAIGFGLVLAGAMVLSRRQIDWRQGVVWGLAGYVAVHLAPAFSLPPELPGMASEGDLIARQTWAMSATALTILGLALIAFAKHWGLKLAGAAAIVLPHLIGVQDRIHAEHAVPVELVAEFIVGTLVITALFWALLGGLTSYFTGRVTAADG